MLKIPLYRFRATLSAVVDRVRHGEVVLLTRHGKVVAQLTTSRPIAWHGIPILPRKTRTKPRVRPFKGPGTMSREILEERRRRG